VRLCLIRSSRLETVICEQRPVIDSLQETAGRVEASCDIVDFPAGFWRCERPARRDCRTAKPCAAKQAGQPRYPADYALDGTFIR
jgi:hypothetical protein